MTKFLFFKNDIYTSAETLDFLEMFKCYNGVLVELPEALYILLNPI